MWVLLFIILVGKIASFYVGAADPLAATALWLLPDGLLGYHMFVARAQGLLRSHRRFKTSRDEVWLTIDDGPDPEDTPRILELLAAHGAQATFFLIGKNAAAHPELVREIIAARHEVAHHTHTHPLASFWCASPARVRRELDDALAVFRTQGVTPTRFRTPAGLKNPWLASALAVRDLTCIGWSARGLERHHRNIEKIVARLTRRLRPGAILLVHEGPSVPAAMRVHAIERLLEELRKRGYRCVIPQPDQLVD